MTPILPNTDQNFENGAGRRAQVGGQDVFYGMEVVVYGFSYWVTNARPSGIGFTLTAVNREGVSFDFKTREVAIAEKPSATTPAVPEPVLPRELSSLDREKHNASLVTNIELVYPNVTISTAHITDEELQQLHSALTLLQRNPTPARLPWGEGSDRMLIVACYIVLANAANWYQALRMARELQAAWPANSESPPKLETATDFLEHWIDSHPIQDHATIFSLRAEPKWQKKLEADALSWKANVRIPNSILKSPTPTGSSKNNNPAVTVTKATGHGDATTDYLKPATSPTELRALLDALKFPDAGAVMQKYAHLSFGLQKMSVTNLLRKSVKTGAISL
jgi:hypothetical protein